MENAADNSFVSLARYVFEALRRRFFKTHLKIVKNAATSLLKHSNAQVMIYAARFMRSVDASRIKLFQESKKNSGKQKRHRNTNNSDVLTIY